MAIGGLSITIEIDATAIVEAYNKGMEDMFVMMQEFDELDKELNVNKIDPDNGPIDI